MNFKIINKKVKNSNEESKKEKIKTIKIKSEKSAKVKSIQFTILAIICIILFSASLAPVTLQNDTYYTVKIGEHIVQTKTVDMKDPFSWHTNLPYTYPHWAYDVIIYFIYSFGGFTGIFISTILLSCILGLITYFTNCKISKNKLISFILTLAMMYLLKDYIAARAQLVTFILLQLTVYIIECFLETKKKRYAIGLILIAIAIANLHCAVWPFFFILFLPYIAEYVCNFEYIKVYFNIIKKINIKRKKYLQRVLVKNKKDLVTDGSNNKINDTNMKINKLNEIFDKINIKEENEKEKSRKRRENPYRIRMYRNNACKWLVVIVIICMFTGFITPLGDTPYTYLIKTMQGNTTKSISEHLPLTLINNIPILITITLLLAILIFTDVKIRLKDLFMLAGLMLLMFITRRQASMFILFGGGIVAKIIADLFEKYDKSGTEEFTDIIISTLGTIATVLLVSLFVIIQVREKVGNEYIDTNSYPVEASKYIKENLDLSSIKLFNEYNYGSYLLYEGIPVFIDSRADLYAPEFNKNSENPNGIDIFSDYINTSGISKYYEDTFNTYNITHIILYKNSRLSMLMSKQSDKYKKLYSDDNFIIYEREK